MKEEIKRVLNKLVHNKLIWVIAIVLGVISVLCCAFYVGLTLAKSDDNVVVKRITDTSTDTNNTNRQVIIIDNSSIQKHSPVQFFETFSSIQGMEDMNNFIVVYTKSQDIRQVVVKDKNSGEIYCYECRRINGDGYEITDSFVRENKIDTADKMKGM